MFRRGWFRWCVFAPLALLVFVASAGFTTFHLMRAAATPRRDAVVAELDAADPNWRTTQLTDARNAALPPPDRNAAELALRAHDKLPPDQTERVRRDGDEWKTDLKPPHLPPAADVADARKRLTAASEAVALARDIRHVPGGGLKMVYQEPSIIGTPLARYQDLREVMALLQSDAYVRAYDRAGDDALDSCLAILAVARGIGDDPWLITQLIRMAGSAIAVGTVERVLGWTDTATDAKLAEVGAAFEREANERRLVYALRGERAMFYRVCENIDSGAMGEVPDTTLNSGNRLLSAPLRATIPEQQATGLRMYTRLIAAADAPPSPARRKRLGAIEDEYARLFGPRRGPLQFHMLVGLLLPAVYKMNETDTRTTAGLLCARVAVACERHRLNTGEYPAALADLPKELLAEVPADPFTGNPLLYKKLDDGAVVYSAGVDGKDDGAAVLDAGKREQADLGFRLFDPKHRRQPPLPKKSLR